MAKKIYDSDNFPLSGQTWANISKENYFKVFNVVEQKFPEEIKKLMKTITTTVIIEPLDKINLLGLISMFNLDNSFPNAKTAKITTLRNKFKKLVVSESNEELNSYLMTEELMDRSTNTKRLEIETTTTLHNKTTHLFHFILSNYFDLDFKDPKKSKEVPEEEEDFTEDDQLEEDLEEVVENPEEIQE